MKRFWTWLKGRIPYDEKYCFYREDMRAESTGTISVEFSQKIYRRRRFFRSDVWRGTIFICVNLHGVRFKGRSGAKPYILYGSQSYTLRCDKDYVELLKHLVVMQQRGLLSVDEQLLLVSCQESLMCMWPARSNQSIHATEETEVDG